MALPRSVGLPRLSAFPVILLIALANTGHAQQSPSGSSELDKPWQAIAPGQIEPVSGEIKIGSSVVGRIAEVLVKVNDKVFPGELLVRLEDEDLVARVAVAEAQAALQKRLRNETAASGRAADRRKAEDAVADAQKNVVEARWALDRASAARRGGGPDGPLNAARTALSRALERLKQQQAELRKFDNQAGVPLPTQPEGQLNVARAELAYANAVLEKAMIRGPIGGTVLQVNAKVGELASPSLLQPLIVLGDVSALRVRAEVAEVDIGAIKDGQPVLVRAPGFRDRTFAGKVSSIAPEVEPLRTGADGRRAPSDSKYVEVYIDLADAGPLMAGMKVEVYFQ